MIETENTFLINMEDSYPAYRHMQETSLVFQIATGQWVILDYENAQELLQSPKCLHWGQDERVFTHLPYLEKAIATTLYALSPESNRPYRKQILHQLAGRSLRIDETFIKQLAEALLSNLKNKQEIDVIKEFAHPFTFGTICRIIGIPEHQHKGFSDLVARMYGGYLACIDLETGQQTKEGTVFIQQLRELISIKRKKPDNDLCSILFSYMGLIPRGLPRQ